LLISNRTFKLFNYIGITDKLIPYLYQGENCPMRYNDIQKTGTVKGMDPFEVNKDIPVEDSKRRIPDK
jgi:hypothetical protein